MKFKKLIAVLVSGVLTMGAVGCGSASNAESDTIKIGGIGPLTGEQASYGTSVKNGCEIAIEEINAAGGVAGKQLELIFEDDECNEQKSVNAYNTLMDKGINALVGSVTSACSIAVGAASEKDGILQVTPSGSAQECTSGSNQFRICFTDPLQGETMAQYIVDNGHKNIAMIYNNGDEYSKGIHDAFVTKAGELGATIVCDESYTTKDVDFKTQLTKIQSSNADCIFLPIYYADVAKITEQAASLGLKLPYYGADGWDGVINQLNGDTKNIENAIFLTPFVATDPDENIQKFVASYKAKSNATPDQFAADGYDAVYAIKAAIEQTNGDLSNEALVGAMTQITVNGLTGDMTFDENGEPNKSAKVAVIQNGQYVAK